MDDLIAHWPFAVVSLILAMMGQMMKATFFTKANIVKYKASAGKLGRITGEVLWWGRKTLPMHPVFAGIALGCLPGMPVGPGIDPGAATVLYFAGAGMASTWAFAVLKMLAKKQGVELDMPRVSDPPKAK